MLYNLCNMYIHVYICMHKVRMYMHVRVYIIIYVTMAVYVTGFVKTVPIGTTIAL